VRIGRARLDDFAELLGRQQLDVLAFDAIDAGTRRDRLYKAMTSKPDREGDQLLRHALARLLLSARAYHRVLRVARSIADLCGKSTISAEHVAEAIQYRRLDASF